MTYLGAQLFRFSSLLLGLPLPCKLSCIVRTFQTRGTRVVLLCYVLTLVDAGARLVYKHALRSTVIATATLLSRTKDARLGRLKSRCFLRAT